MGKCWYLQDANALSSGRVAASKFPRTVHVLGAVCTPH
jgi:hypothetical protein